MSLQAAQSWRKSIMAVLSRAAGYQSCWGLCACAPWSRAAWKWQEGRAGKLRGSPPPLLLPQSHLSTPDHRGLSLTSQDHPLSHLQEQTRLQKPSETIPPSPQSSKSLHRLQILKCRELFPPKLLLHVLQVVQLPSCEHPHHLALLPCQQGVLGLGHQGTPGAQVIAKAGFHLKLLDLSCAVWPVWGTT